MWTKHLSLVLPFVLLPVSVLVSRAAAQDGAPAAVAQATASARVLRDLQISDKEAWTTTDLELKPGERAVFKASGMGRCEGEQNEFGPNGLTRGFRDLLRVLPFNQAGRGALIGRIGDQEVAQPFLVGEARELVSPIGGSLALGINKGDKDPCTAAYSVHVDVYAPADGTRVVVAREVSEIEGVDQALFARIPRRIGDLQGNPGDMVNFVILGSQGGMEKAFKAAGWVAVDPDVRGALITGVISSLSKESYVTMPMSQLYLFGRAQDYGWAHAEPIKVVSSRHHLRIWKAPFQAGTSTLWVGAATHDIGFERDQRNNGVTHKIDPNIDLERDYVEKTLSATGLISELTHVTPPNPLRDAKTATGGSFYSDGRVLIFKLDEGSGTK
jgi:LssY-like putative type I secretion system component LssY